MNFWALRAPRKENNTCDLSAVRLQPLTALGCEELQDSGPRQLRYTWKEWFHWTQTPASPHIEKNTKFLNLRYLVFFNSQKYFCYSDYLPLVANFYITWLLPPPPGSSSLRVTWDGWMASPTQWTWIWASSRRWGGTGRPGLLQSMGRKESDTNEWLKKSNNNLRCCLQGLSPKSVSRSVVSTSLRPHRLYSPWNSPARILESVAYPFSRRSSQPRSQTGVSHTAGGFFTNWAMQEAH